MPNHVEVAEERGEKEAISSAGRRSVGHSRYRRVNERRLDGEASQSAPQYAQSPGVLFERGLLFHEAWFEASLSLPPGPLKREFYVLLQHLRDSLGVDTEVMTGAELNWRVVLRPPLAPRWAEVTPAGVRLLTVYDPPPAQSQTIINTYPLRRHYDCSGKALESPAPGADRPQVPCLQSSQTNAPVQVGRSSNDGAILVPLKGVLDCYQVIQPVGPLFYLGQILVNSPQSSYILHKEEGGKLRLRLRENQVVLTTEKKTARGYRITLD